MKAIAAKEAKNRFGSLMDTAQREPVAIEKHGRAVAVIMSVEEYRCIKLGRLQAEVGQGLEQLEHGQFVTLNRDDMDALFENIQSKGQARRHAKA
ncbi:MAG: type II toxin-antitoxin system Phd/YefM family antitoxin [Mariprofundus sp.]|nr:type II toxin-antitoxin system Phd/YefM family antitoxin [Mariprofundus sp.]